MQEEHGIDDSSEGGSENEYDETEQTKDENDDDQMAGDNDVKVEKGDSSGQPKKAKFDAKDPLRPRRKKARRACFACQRAHLTCGDERPCIRCIKRGLADGCQDGVRKKAKYLHDAPPEALGPVLGPNYTSKDSQQKRPLSNSTSASDTSPGIGGFFPQINTTPNFSLQYQQLRPNQMPPPLQESISYTSQPSPISPAFATPNETQMMNMSGLTTTSMPNNPNIQTQLPLDGPMFDPSNPAFFNFNLEGLEFGNQYGAMEFSILNHMSNGAAETPPLDKHGSLSESTYSFNTSMGPYAPIYPSNDNFAGDYSGLENNDGSFDTPRTSMHPRAYAIEAGPTSLASPSTDAHASPQASLAFDSSPTANTYSMGGTSSTALEKQSAQHRHMKRQESKSLLKPPEQLSKQTRDPSSIYSSVTEPYSYTEGFHSLKLFIRSRFSPNNTLKIAKSLASIRPSFISCTKALNRQDLVFMEKCFQRTLFEYEGFMKDCGTPTIVCRRTGEVAAINKEFTLMTGWTKSVLLGEKENLNVNTGKSDSRTASGPNTGRAGLTTPRMMPMVPEKVSSGPRPILLPELLDDDAVIEFYDDFSRLAFSDARSSVMKRGKVLKYLTKEMVESSDAKEQGEKGDAGRKRKDRVVGGLGGRVRKIDGEHGIENLQRDGKMDCAYCWTVKRDVFEVPMLIVINFLPCV